MTPISLLRAALTVQVLLGFGRFLAPFAGVEFPHRPWLVHPVLGLGIAAAALWLLRTAPAPRRPAVAPPPDSRCWRLSLSASPSSRASRAAYRWCWPTLSRG